MADSPTNAVAGEFRPSTMQMIWHYARGEYPCYLAADDGPIGWRTYSHRGIHRMDKIHIGDKQKRDVFNKKFEIRYNTAMEQVLRACAAGRPGGYTWLTEHLIQAFLKLYEMGYAYSAECWSEGKLGGGLFGVHLGSFVSVDSMFHTVSNASKAAYVQLILRMRDRGFALVDVNDAKEMFLRFGAETVREWEFEEMLRPLVLRPLSLFDDKPAIPLPTTIRAGLVAERILRGTLRRARLLLGKSKPAANPTPTAAEPPAPAEEKDLPPANHAA